MRKTTIILVLSTLACGGAEPETVGFPSRPTPASRAPRPIADRVQPGAALDLDISQLVLGVSVDPRDGRLHVVTEDGIATFERDGTRVDWHLLRDDLFAPSPGDLASLGDGRFLVAYPEVVKLVDTVAGTTESFFCLVPVDYPPDQDRHNDALAVELSSNAIYAAPFVIDHTQDNAFDGALARYRASDGEPVATLAFDANAVQPGGLAYDEDGRRFVAVAGEEVLALDPADARVLARAPLPGVAYASGAAIEGDALLVTDEVGGVLRVFSLAALLD